MSLLTFFVFVAGGGGVLSNSYAMGGVVLTLMFVASWRWWIPVTFELSSQGIRQSVWGVSRRIAWTSISRYESLGRGVLLLSDNELTPFSYLRGLYIPCARECDELLENIEYFLARKRRISTSTTRTFEAERPRTDGMRTDSARNSSP